MMDEVGLRFPVAIPPTYPTALAGSFPEYYCFVMKIESAEFATSAPDLRACPAWALPEFALIGRSNVGKSSLVNLLAGQAALAKVSDTPGKTKLLNFFAINRVWSLVDLPGYGYAKVGREQRYEFNQAVADFIERRDTLRRVFALIDSRLPPQAIDTEFLRWLDGTSVPFTLVFTKTDKQSPTQTRAQIETFMTALAEWRSEAPPVIASSAKTKDGRAQILAAIDADLSRKPGDAG
jgi:GTP-binding protein